MKVRGSAAISQISDGPQEGFDCVLRLRQFDRQVRARRQQGRCGGGTSTATTCTSGTTKIEIERVCNILSLRTASKQTLPTIRQFNQSGLRS